MQPNDRRQALNWIPHDPNTKEQARKRLRSRCLERIEAERSLKRNASVMRSREMWINAMVQEEAANMGHVWTEEVRSHVFIQEIGNIIREEYHHIMNVYEQQYCAEMGELSLDQLLAIEEEIVHETTFSSDK